MALTRTETDLRSVCSAAFNVLLGVADLCWFAGLRFAARVIILWRRARGWVTGVAAVRLTAVWSQVWVRVARVPWMQMAENGYDRWIEFPDVVNGFVHRYALKAWLFALSTHPGRVLSGRLSGFKLRQYRYGIMLGREVMRRGLDGAVEHREAYDPGLGWTPRGRAYVWQVQARDRYVRHQKERLLMAMTQDDRDSFRQLLEGEALDRFAARKSEFIYF